MSDQGQTYNHLYFDCELPRVRRQLDDPEGFFAGLRGKRLVLDEVHRLANPSEILKIAADDYPDILIVATGSSTLQASGKFRDTLTGRKEEIWLTPIISRDLSDFKRPDLAHRFLFGGLPPFFLSNDLPERDFQEWMDSFWAKDVLELFRLERKNSFQRFMELLFAQSGGIFEATRFARPCEVSRTTITNYLSVLEATWTAHVVRPFSTYRPAEIVSAPKVYGFDTGFVCYYRGWDHLRPEDYGILWEHYVMNELHGLHRIFPLRYWRDKRGHEVDFVLTGRGGRPLVAIECKWSADDFKPQGMQAFRRQYPEGTNVVVAGDVDRPYSRIFKEMQVVFCSLSALGDQLAKTEDT